MNLKVILFLTIFFISFEYSHSQSWQSTTPFWVENFFQTSDSGFIASGEFANTNARKLDKSGKTVWEKKLFFDKAIVVTEVQDGFLGYSVVNNGCYCKNDSLVFKINKDGDSLYAFRASYSKFKAVDPNIVMIYEDSLIKFNHISRKFSWKKDYGSIKDLYYKNHQYHLLAEQNNQLSHVTIDTNGNALSYVPVVQKYNSTPSLFYKNGLINFYTHPVGYNEMGLLSYINFSGDTLWKKTFIADGFPFEKEVAVDLDYVYFTNATPDSSIFNKVDSTGKLLWQSKRGNGYGLLMSGTNDGGIIAACTTYANSETENLFGYYLLKYAPTDVVTSVEVKQTPDWADVYYDIVMNEYHVRRRQSAAAGNLSLRLNDMHGHSVFDADLNDQEIILKGNTVAPGVYFLNITNNQEQFTTKLFYK